MMRTFMSRSRKKNPISGWTTARSEKKDKRILNRSLRRHVNVAMKQEDREESVLPIPDEIMDKWSMSKDGKGWRDKVERPNCKNCKDKIVCLVDEDYKWGCSLWYRWHHYEKIMRK